MCIVFRYSSLIPAFQLDGFIFWYRGIGWLGYEMCVVFYSSSSLIPAYQLDGHPSDASVSTAWSMTCVSFSENLCWFQRISMMVLLLIPTYQLPGAWGVYRYLLIFADSSVSAWFFLLYCRIIWLQHDTCIVFCYSSLISQRGGFSLDTGVSNG